MSNDDSNLVRMANQIVEAFKASPPDEALAAVAAHIKASWAPQLRRRLIEQAATGNSGLLPVGLRAVHVLKAGQTA